MTSQYEAGKENKCTFKRLRWDEVFAGIESELRRSEGFTVFECDGTRAR